MAQITLNSSGVASNGTLALQSNGTTTAVTIDTSQNVGIGTNTPTATLTVNTASSTGVRVFKTSDNSSNLLGLYDSQAIANAAYTFIGTDATGSTVGFASGGNFVSVGKNGTATVKDLILHTYDATNIRFATSNTERMRIDSSGNLLVGTTALSSNYRFQTLAASGGNGWFFQNTTNGNNAAIFVNAAGSGVGSISVSSTATAYNTSSDYRLKENIAPMTGALEKVALLKPCTYKWKVDGSNGQGFIAHELAEIEAGCVTGEKDAVDAEGNPVYQGIDTSFLVATLTAAIQEQQAIITQLQADVAALKGTA